MQIAKLFFIITGAVLLGGCGPSKAEEERAAKAAAAAELAKRLRIAAGDNNAAEVIQLLDNGAEVNAKDKYGWTLLHRAARENAAAVAKILIDNGAEVNAKDGGTPLHWAAENNAAAVAKILIDNGAEVNANAFAKDGDTPLDWAARENAAAVAKLLIDNGAEVNAKHNDGRTLLHRAASGKRNGSCGTADCQRRGGQCENQIRRDAFAFGGVLEQGGGCESAD